jgi:hypothetical protein
MGGATGLAVTALKCPNGSNAAAAALLCASLLTTSLIRAALSPLLFALVPPGLSETPKPIDHADSLTQLGQVNGAGTRWTSLFSVALTAAALMQKSPPAPVLTVLLLVLALSAVLSVPLLSSLTIPASTIGLVAAQLFFTSAGASTTWAAVWSVLPSVTVHASLQTILHLLLAFWVRHS